MTSVNANAREAPPSLELGLVGNCTFNALIDAAATVVWCCMPRPDGDPVLHALLGKAASSDVTGRFAIEIDSYRVVQAHIEDIEAELRPLFERFAAEREKNERFGDFTTWRAAGSVLVLPTTRLRASVGTAFREPTFLENYGGAYAIGNPDLSPEHALSAELEALFIASNRSQRADFTSIPATFLRVTVTL